MKININDQFAVHLTKVGYQRLCEELTVCAADGRVVQSGENTALVCYPARSDGSRVFCLHELMRYFGAHMSIAATMEELPFATEIELLGKS